MIANILEPCPNVQDINLEYLPRDPMITAAVSEMFFAANRNALQEFHVDSPLTEEASKAVCKSQNLRRLSVAIEKGTSIPSVSLPNLTRLQIDCEDEGDVLQLLRGATFGELESVHFYIESRPTNDFLEAFKEAALSSSIQSTLSTICITANFPQDLDYSPLLPFTQLVDLDILFPCYDSCSGVNDDTLIDLSRAMPNLQLLGLGSNPCRQFAGGATAKGLMALAHNCPNLSSLRVHFQVASLSDPPTSLETTRNTGYSASRTDCALMELDVGRMPVPEGSASMIALALLRIFPQIQITNFMDEGWDEVEDELRRSKEIIDCSSTTTSLYLEIPR